MSRKLILFLVSCGLLLLLSGFCLLLLYVLYQQENHYIRPVIVVGPVLIGAGFMTIMFSVEICVRLDRAKKRVKDPDLDNLINPHEVKHWMDPKLIPYGWGLFKEDEEIEKSIAFKKSSKYIIIFQ